jgi:hypothetical protein
MKFNVMRMGVFVFLMFAMAGLTVAQNNASCNQGQKIAENIWERFGPWKPNITLNSWKSSVNKVRTGWNWIASNGVVNVGPRLLEVNEGHESGTIMGQTQRTFVTPPNFEDNVTVTIVKTHGKAQADVTICLQSQNGQMTNVVQYTFPNSKRALSKIFQVPNARGKVLVVAMRNNSVGNRFVYDILAN